MKFYFHVIYVKPLNLIKFACYTFIIIKVDFILGDQKIIQLEF